MTVLKHSCFLRHTSINVACHTVLCTDSLASYKVLTKLMCYVWRAPKVNCYGKLCEYCCCQFTANPGLLFWPQIFLRFCYFNINSSSIYILKSGCLLLGDFHRDFQSILEAPQSLLGLSCLLLGASRIFSTLPVYNICLFFLGSFYFGLQYFEYTVLLTKYSSLYYQ